VLKLRLDPGSQKCLEARRVLEVGCDGDQPPEIIGADLPRRLRVLGLVNDESVVVFVPGAALQVETVDAPVVRTVADELVGVEVVHADDVPQEPQQ
jgi:hypothetical protein